MQVTLTPELQQLIERNMQRGGYATAEEALMAGMVSLEQQIEFGDFEAGEMNRLLEEGEKSGAFLEGDEVLRELRELRQRGGQGRA